MSKAKKNKPKKSAPKRPAPKIKTIHARELSNIKMVSGRENTINTVIDEGVVKDWVGIGWIDLREATDEDRQKFPTVVRDEDIVKTKPRKKKS